MAIIKMHGKGYETGDIGTISLRGLTLYFTDLLDECVKGVSPGEEGYQELQSLMYERNGKNLEQELKVLSGYFSDIQEEVERLQSRLKTLERVYPGFKGYQSYIELSNGLYVAQGMAKSIVEDIIPVATDEDWTQEP